MIPYGMPALDLSSVPTDPATFLSWFQAKEFPRAASDDGYINQDLADRIASYLADNVLPANLRTTMFKALALIPDATLLDTKGENSTIQYAGRSLIRITIDDSTGLVTDWSSFLNEPQAATQSMGPVPAGIPDVSTTVRVTTNVTLPTDLNDGLR
jgi:hypothetical protein